MKQSERHHLKDNELALALGQANMWAGRNQRTLMLTIAGVVLLIVAAVGFVTWRNSQDAKARTLLAEAMVVQEARVAPVVAPDPAAPGTPATPPALQPGTYPTERAKLEAALPKYMTAADRYPGSDAGQTARYHAASILVGLGRFDEAVQQYDRVIADASGLLPQMARLGKAEAQLRATKYDAAIGSFKELSERTDLNVPKEALLLELARAYRLAGKGDDARKTLTQIVEQHAASPFAAEAKTELAKM
ncbi:MAG TPA: tetratricopeptide repeat protein [Vicinamibacterales bacterium]|nr:tetratricopeptide repeat protein [Vicinamibacterales bacterium]